MLSIQGAPLRPEARSTPLHQAGVVSGGLSGYSARRLANRSRHPRTRKTASSPFPAVGAGVGLPSKLGKIPTRSLPISDIDLPGQLARPTVERIAKILAAARALRRFPHATALAWLQFLWHLASLVDVFPDCRLHIRQLQIYLLWYWCPAGGFFLYGPPRTGWPRPRRVSAAPNPYYLGRDPRISLRGWLCPTDGFPFGGSL